VRALDLSRHAPAAATLGVSMSDPNPPLGLVSVRT
jgi:hypothetical protein